MTVHPCTLHGSLQNLATTAKEELTPWKLPVPGFDGRPALCDKAPRPGCWLEPLLPREDSSADYKEIFNLFQSSDWASKDPMLGDMNRWPYSLKTIIQLVLMSDKPQCILWGKDLICIYNAAYWRHIGTSNHPDLMGMPANKAFVHMLGTPCDPYPALQKALKSGRPVTIPESLYLRSEKDDNTVQEIYTSCSISTIYGDNSSPIGLLCTHTETTMKVMSARRSKTTRALLNATQHLSTLPALKSKLQLVFEDCGLDFPICLILLRPDYLNRSSKQDMAEQDFVQYETWVHAGLDDAATSLRSVDFSEPIQEGDPPRHALFSHLARRCHETRGTIKFEAERLDERCIRRNFGISSTQGQLSPFYETDAQNRPNLKPLGFILLCFTPVRPLNTYYMEYAHTIEELVITVFQNLQEIDRSEARLNEVTATRKTMERYFLVLNDSPVGISVMDWNTKEILFGNKRLRTVLGLTEDIPIESWPDCILPEDLPTAREAMTDVAPGDERAEYIIRTKRLHTNGKSAFISVNNCFHQDIRDNGEISTFLMTAVHDCSDQMYARDAELIVARENERLQAARQFEAERADEADRAKARQLDYIDTLAHEIRNPISAIVQTVDVLLERVASIEESDPERVKVLQEITNDLGTIDICTGHMSRVVNDALNISKLEHGSLTITPQECDLVDGVSSVLRMLRQDMNNKGISCDPVAVDADSAKIFRRAVTDPLRYKQIVLNLMTNAVKFTALQSGTKRIHVTLTAKQSETSEDEHLLSCRVQDTAKGMSPDAIERIFGKFYQANSRTHVEYGGSGLGLFISQRLATLLGGKIHVTSELGIGSCFTFEMPTRLAITKPQCSCNLHDQPSASEELSAGQLQQTMENLANAIPAPETGRHRRNRSSSNESHVSTSPSRTRKSATPPTLPGSPLVGVPSAHKPGASQDSARRQDATPETLNTVLVVEDNLINQKLLVKQLQMAGYNVLVGNHGLEALQHFKEGRRIDLVVTDIEMPVMNGMETIAAVRALKDSVHQPPFIACSAYAREEQRQAFLEAGMIDVIAKPFKFADLKIRVEHVLKYRLPFRREYTV